MNLNFIIASNLKKLRGDRNLSLSKLSELSGVSKVMLGQIERGESNPTINTIWKIANGLKVPYTHIIDEHKPNVVLVKKEKALSQCSEDGNYRILNYFSTSTRRNFELFKVELDGKSSYCCDGHLEKTLEYVLVFEGELTIVTENKKYILKAEDSIEFDSSKPHTYINNCDSMVKMTIINYYSI